MAFDGKLWVLGGQVYPYWAMNDVWSLTPVTLGIDAGQQYLYNPGETMTLKVTASKLSGQVSYQWKKNRTPVYGVGAKSDTYHIDAFTAADAGAYTCDLSGGTMGTAGPVQIGFIPPKVPVASPAGLAFGVCLAAAMLILRKRAST